MKNALQDLIAFVLLQIARLGAPSFQRALGRLATTLVGDVPNLEGHWSATFRWPQTENREFTAGVDVELRQYGRFIRGIGHVQGEPGDPFEYTGRIRRNILYGSFQRKDAHVLAGTGAFITKINADSRQMDGSCTWYASHLDSIWRSSYAWRKWGG